MWRGLTLAWVSGGMDRVAFGILPVGFNWECKAVGKFFVLFLDEKATHTWT